MSAVFLIGLSALSAAAGEEIDLDGIILTLQEEKGASSRIVRHDIEEGRVVRRAVLLDDVDKHAAASISPDGARVVVMARRKDIPRKVGVMSIDGGEVRWLADIQAGELNFPRIVWSSSEGGAWAYYLSHPYDDGPADMWRVHVETGRQERVIRFNGSNADWAMSRDISPTTGRLFIRNSAGGSEHNLYEMSVGDGDLTRDPLGGDCGNGITPDGRLGVRNNTHHNGWYFTSFGATEVPKPFKINAFVSEKESDGSHGRATYTNWGVNNTRWFFVRQGNNRVKPGYANAVLYNPFDKQQIFVTRNGPGRKDKPLDFFDTRPGAVTPRHFRGEAPMTVRFEAPDEQDGWRWGFGDGRTAEGPAAEVDFEKPGAYEGEAVRDERRMPFTVTVLPAGKPKISEHVVIDPRRVLVTFDERVSLDEATVRLGERALPAEALRLGPGRRRLLVNFPEAMGGSVRLRFSGVRDHAQQPNRMDETTLTLLHPAWPSDRTGLMFAWQDRAAHNYAFDEELQRIEPSRLLVEGTVGYDAAGRMDLTGDGGFRVLGEGPLRTFGRRLRKGEPVSVELTFTPATPDGEGVILAMDKHKHGPLVRLIQTEGRIVASVRAGDEAIPVDLGPAGTAPVHVVLVIEPGRLGAFVDGKARGLDNGAIAPTSWRLWRGKTPLVIGQTSDEKQSWRGTAEGVAIYARALNAAEAEGNRTAYRAVLATRKDLPRAKVRARLVEATDPPTPEEIRPYRDGLVFDAYRLERVLEGELSGLDRGATIHVARWAVKNSRAVAKKTAADEADAAEVLVLEAFDDHPELKPVYQVSPLEDLDAQRCWLVK